MKDLKQKLREYKDFFYPLFILGALFLLLKFFFLPKLFEVFKLRESIERQKTEIEDLASYLNYLKEAASYSLAVEEEAVNYALPYEKNVISLMATFDGLGKIEGTTLSPVSLKPGLISKEEEKEEEKVEEIAFEMEATAEDKESAKKLLQEIYLTGRILEIKDLKWSTIEDEKIKLNVSSVAYYWPKLKAKPSQKLLEARENQASILEKLRQTKIYEEGVLESVSSGKEDLFSL